MSKNNPELSDLNHDVDVRPDLLDDVLIVDAGEHGAAHLGKGLQIFLSHFYSLDALELSIYVILLSTILHICD